MQKKVHAISWLLILAVSAVCAAGTKENAATAQKAAAANYTFGGSSTVAPIVEAAIEPFEAKNPDMKVSYETLGSSVGLKGLQSGTLSMAGSSRDLKPQEVSDGLKPTTIALDGLSVAVHGDVGVTNLTMAQLASLFAGEVSNWKELGGNDEAVHLIVRDETSGTYGSFKEIVLDKAKKAPTKDAIVAKENGELAAKVASTPGSVGYIGMAFGHIVASSGGKVLTIDGVAPSSANVLNGTYPISRALYLVTKGDPQGGEKRFIDYLLSDEGQALVSEAGFIPVK